MASYPYPIESDIFNDRDFIGNNDVHESTESSSSIDLTSVVHKSGDIMTGPLVSPEIQTGKLSFYDNSLQEHAFTSQHKLSIESLETKTQYITINDDDITAVADIAIDTIHFNNTSNVQTQPFTDALNTTINTNTTKLTGISYNGGSSITSIANTCNINNLTCGNINTSHLSGTTSSLQTQITTQSTKTQQIAYESNTTATSIKDSSGSGFILVTNAGNNEWYNPKTQINDTVIVSKGNVVDNNALVLTNWSNTKSGIRITPTGTNISNINTEDMIRLTSSNAYNRQIEGIGYLVFADTGNLTSQNSAIQFLSASGVYYDNNALDGSHIFAVSDASGNQTIPSRISTNGLTFPNGSIQSTAYVPTTNITATNITFPNGSIQTTAYIPSTNVTFPDGSTQTTAFIPSNIPTAPVGSISAYLGTTSPTGYLLCQGQQVSRTQYAALYAVIGNNYTVPFYAPELIPNDFLLPDLRMCFLKGAGQQGRNYFDFDPTKYAGVPLHTKSKQSVQQHIHQYNDRGEGSKSVADSGPSGNTTIANDTDNYFFTEATYITDDLGANMPNSNITEPYNVAVNYIIKF